MKAREVGPGSYVLWEGQVYCVDAVDSTRVRLINEVDSTICSVRLQTLMVECRPCNDDGTVESVEQDLTWQVMTQEESRQVLELSHRLYWVITGQEYETGAPTVPSRGQGERLRQLADELKVSSRTIERWKKDFWEGRPPSIDTSRKRGHRIDPRWTAKAEQIRIRNINETTISRKIVFEEIERELVEEFGDGVVPIPDSSTAYRFFKTAYRGKNAYHGSAKGRRSIAERPDGMFGRLAVSRPGQYLVMDTHHLDVHAMEPVTMRWVPAQLTVAMDLHTRCVVGLTCTPIAERAVDVAAVLFEALCPRPARGLLHPNAKWPYHGIPRNIVFTENGDYWGFPVTAAESLIVDNGKSYVSQHTISVCQRMGINVMPGQVYKPTDKPQIERFFRTLREDLIQRLPAYTGPDIHSRGKDLEEDAFMYIHELEELIRNWVTRRYHKKDHAGLRSPLWHGDELAPNEAYEVGVAAYGLPRLSPDPWLFVEFLPTEWRLIQHYGIDLNKRIYDHEILHGDTFGKGPSPYGGRHPGKWPIRYDPNDIRYAYIQNPIDNEWAQLEWDHAHLLNGPLTEDSYRYLRRRATKTRGQPEEAHTLIEEWSKDQVLDRRGRNAVIRQAHITLKNESPSFPATPHPSPARTDQPVVRAIDSGAAREELAATSGTEFEDMEVVADFEGEKDSRVISTVSASLVSRIDADGGDDGNDTAIAPMGMLR